MITSVDKIKIKEYLNKHASGDLYYDDFKEIVNRKKCTDKDLLEYFIICSEQFLEKQNISFKLFLKYLELSRIFIQIMQELEVKIPDEMIKRIILLKQNYEIFCRVSQVESDEKVSCFLNDLFHYISENYEISLVEDNRKASISEIEIVERRLNKEIEHRNVKIEEQALIIDEKEKKIVEQREKIRDLRKEKEQIELAVSDLKKIVRNLQKLVDESKNNELKSESIIADLTLRVQELEDRIVTLQNTKAELETRIIFLEEELNKMIKIKDEKEFLLSEKKELQRKLDSSLIQIKELENWRAFKSFGDQVDVIILEKLYSSGISLEELQSFLEHQQISLSLNEIRKRIQYLGLQFSIGTSFKKGRKNYFISSLPSLENTNYSIDLVDEKSYIDFLFVADSHIYEANIRNTVDIFDSIIDFCIKNGISQVFHLGDFFDFNRYCSSSIYDFKKMANFKELVSQLIERIPKEKSIEHIILGGNHDEDLLHLGVDLLKYFIAEREEFSFAGYQNSLLKVIHNDILVGNFLLSHPYKGIVRSGLKGEVKNFEEQFSTDISFAFFGHHHSSYLDLEAKGCIVPSLAVDRVCNGAWFVRMNLKENHLNNMVFKPLILEKKLVPVSEFVYSVPKCEKTL